MRKSISILLIISIMPALLAVPQAVSQTLTSTSVLVGTRTVISYEDTISPTGSGRYCWYTYEKLTASAGSQYSGSFTTDNKITFLIMTDDQYRNRQSGDLCQGQPEFLVRHEDVNSYSFEWNAPSEGTYYFLFVDQVLGQGFTVSFKLWQQFTATTTIINIYSSVTSSPSTFTTPIIQGQPTQFSFGQDTLLILGAIVLVGLALGSLVFLSRRKPTPQLGVCTNCGAKLPSDATFCGECGHPVRAKN